MKSYKVDWLAFSVGVVPGHERDDQLMTALGYDLTGFDEVPGRYFYNSGATLGNYVNVYWNDPDKPVAKNSSQTMTVVFTGQGTTDLALKWGSDWHAILTLLNDWQALNFTRIDLALDDWDGLVSLDKIEDKLRRGHYRSSKKTFNVVQTSDAKGSRLGKTIYIGDARADGGSRGNVYARFYDKKAQYESKGELFSSEVQEHWTKTGREVWQRYEISYSKTYAQSAIHELLEGVPVGGVFMGTLRNLLEILTPRGRDKNKSRWYHTQWWDEFIAEGSSMSFGQPERDVMLGGLLEWLRVSVLPSLGILERLGRTHGFDIYDELRRANKPAELSKKQTRLLKYASTLSPKAVRSYLDEYLAESLLQQEEQAKQEVQADG